MAGNTPEHSILEQLRNNSRNRDLPLFLPFILGLATTENNSNPLQDSSNQPQQTQETTRIIFINPLTQSMVVLQPSGSQNMDSFFNDIFNSKDGQPPASKSSIEAMKSVEITEENCEGECVICLEDWKVGEVGKEMPCKHRFHGNCIEKWLKIHGSCPVCRFNMPVDEDQDVQKKNETENRGRGRGVWVSFSVLSDHERSQNRGDSQNRDNSGTGPDESSDS